MHIYVDRRCGQKEWYGENSKNNLLHLSSLVVIGKKLCDFVTIMGLNANIKKSEP